MKVITVFKTHFDIGYTKLAGEIIKEYGGSMLERAVAVCEETQCRGETREYKWTMAAWPLYKALQTADPDLRTRAEKLMACVAVYHAYGILFGGRTYKGVAFLKGTLRAL